MKNKIKELLNDIGIPMHLKGYEYWIEAIEYYMTNSRVKKMGQVYDKLAKQFNTTKYAVDRDLRYPIYRYQKQIKDYFKVNYKIKVPCFLKFIIEKLKTK